VISQIILYIRQKNVPVKNALIIAFLIFTTIASAADYYISSSGNDANNGFSSSTPWKTIAKVNSSFSTIKAGDRVLFNRGDTFYGTLNISRSGIASNPITISAYGTGADPIISGFTTLTSWSSSGGGIFKSPITSSTTINMVTLDGVPQALGRYPNTGYLTFESHVTNISITDNELPATPDWTGAEVVIRRSAFEIYRNPITNHSTHSLTYSNSFGEPTDGYGYFIQNSIKTLDTFGEWYFDGTNLYMFFGDKNPNTFNINASTIDRLVNIYGVSYITLEGISFQGSNVAAIGASKYNNVIIQNCKIDYSGQYAIAYIDNIYNSYYFTIDNCIINNSLNTAICLNDNCIKSIIINNTITNTGLLPGMGPIKGSANFGAIYSIGSKGRYEYNKIENVGRNGIWFLGDSSLVKNNFIDNFSLVLDDAGGIYLSDWSVTYGKQIIGNIILNGIGNRDGVPNNWPEVEGIYLDYGTKNVEITGNTVANCGDGGIKIHSAGYSKIEDNTCYNNLRQSLFLHTESAFPITNLVINNNIYFSKEKTQVSLFFSSITDNIPNFGSANNNYYIRPIDDVNVFYINQPSNPSKNLTLAGWQSFTKQDVNSHKSPIALTNNNGIMFEYNSSKTNTVISLNQPMIDAKGTKFVNSITLLPYTSVVLMVDPNPAQPIIPGYTGSVIENATPSLLEITYDVSLSNIVPVSSAFTVQVNSVARTVNSIAISGTKVQLTLASPVINGNVVTVTYTKPPTNALQSTSGGQAASFSAQTVTNNVAPPTPPIYVSSAIENATPGLLELVYSLSLAVIVPLTSAFTVRVNSVIRSVSSVAISGIKVQLTLASPVVYGDIITVDYTKPSTNLLQTSSGGQAASFIAQTVTNKVFSLTLPTYISSSIENATPSLLVMTFNMALANLVPAASAFSVRVNSLVRIVTAVAITGTKVQLTLASPIISGDVVTVTYIKPTGNPLQTVSGAIAGNISNQPVINNCINNAPTVVITSPINNSSFPASSNITITANVLDVDGSIILIEFYNGSTKIGSKASAPYSFTWNNVAAGIFSLTVVATDNLNVKTVSSAISISVINGSINVNQLPVIKISNPLKGNKYFTNSTISIEAIASDPDGSISKVEFYNGQVKLVELTSAPYTYIWKNVAEGSYSITAIATDNLNGTTFSSPVEFVVGTNIKYDANSEIIKLYPNPNDGHFSIEFIIPLPNKKSEIMITDLAGKQVYNGPVSKEETLKQFDLSNSKDGIYIMMIKDKEIVVTKKIIKR